MEPGTVVKPERAGREGDSQPLPTPERKDLPRIHEKVAADLIERMKLGIRRYGTPLQPFNGRSSLRDAYEEALDLTVYLATALYEAENAGVPDYAWRLLEAVLRSEPLDFAGVVVPPALQNVISRHFGQQLPGHGVTLGGDA